MINKDDFLSEFMLSVQRTIGLGDGCWQDVFAHGLI